MLRIAQSALCGCASIVLLVAGCDARPSDGPADREGPFVVTNAPEASAQTETSLSDPVASEPHSRTTAVDPAAVHEELFERGERWFDAVCSACHNVSPPPNLAPPIVMVARHYLDEYDTREAAEDAVATWIRAPDPERSALPEHAIERFGVMPPQPLLQEDAEAVAFYVFELFDQQLAVASDPDLVIGERSDAASEAGTGMRGMGSGMGAGMEPGMGSGMGRMRGGMDGAGHMHRHHRGGG